MLQSSLKDLGWRLNVNAITDGHSGNLSVNGVVKKALDLDLRLIVENSSNESKPHAKTCLLGPLVVQLQKTVNIAVPKDQSETSLQNNSRRLLLVTLTDGSTSYQAVEMQPIRGLSMDTPPGTKVRLTGEINLWKGFLQLYPSNVEILGGNVAKLVSAWEVSRQLGSRTAILQRQNQRQQTGPGGHGPPTFVPFGQKIPSRYDVQSTDNFRAMDALSKEKPQSGGNGGLVQDDDVVDEFSEQRQAAIAKVLDEQKKKQKSGDTSQKKLAIPDISQLTISTKPTSAPPKPNPIAPVVTEVPRREREDHPPPSGRGRGRRGRGGSYDDDFETAASVGRPSQFRLFDVIRQQPGQDILKQVAETAAASAPSSSRSSISNSYGRRHDGEPGDGELWGGSRRGGRGGRGGGRGRGGGSASARSNASTSRNSYGGPASLFREGSAASSRGVDSASPLSDQGGRSGTGRELPPRLKRHQQVAHQAPWAEEAEMAADRMVSGYFEGGSVQNPAAIMATSVANMDLSLAVSHHGPATPGVAEHNHYGEENDEAAAAALGMSGNFATSRPDRTGGKPGTGHQLVPAHQGHHPQLAAIYPPVLSPDGTSAYNPQVAPPDSIMAHAFPSTGFTVVGPPAIHDIPFLPYVSSPPPVSSTAAPQVGPQQPHQAPPSSSSQSSQSAPPQTQPAPVSQSVGGAGPSGGGSTSSSDAVCWRPGMHCLARWNDGGYYPVYISSVDPQTQTAFVNYYQYNDSQTVPLNALHPLPIDASGSPATLPQPVVLAMLTPATMQPTSGPELVRQQQRMMWINATGSPLLPPPPPFPGEHAFASRMSMGLLPSEGGTVISQSATTLNSNAVAATVVSPAGAESYEAAESNEKAVEQPNNENVPVETAVAAG